MSRKKNLLTGFGNTPLLLGQRHRLLLQGFHWQSHESNWLKMLQDFVTDFKQLSITDIWLPPFSKSADLQGYLPNEWFVFDSEYGSEAELNQLTQLLHENQIGIIADMVLNHRVGTTNYTDFTQPSLGLDAITQDDECGIGQGALDTGAGYHAARDLDHANSEVQAAIIEWLLLLKKRFSVTGYRFDYAKGFERKYFTKYLSRVRPDFSVAEYWIDFDVNHPEKGRSDYFNWLTQASDGLRAFDFPTKMLLQEAVRHCDYKKLVHRHHNTWIPSGLIGMAPGRSVTFVDNHDTGPSDGKGQNHMPFPADHVMQGLAYILTHPGTPCLYWPHVFAWGMKMEIKALIDLRKAAGINSRSQVKVHEANNQHYVAEIDSKVMLKIGPSFWKPEEKGWQLNLYGENYAIWTQSL